LRAYRHTSFTGFDALDLVDEDIPQPGAGQVLVRVRASSLNFRGLLTFPWVIHRGSGGQSPASLSIARAISGRGE
jgi:NADPH:quinone reductase-like Zn-dependent oxidoreductase